MTRISTDKNQEKEMLLGDNFGRRVSILALWALLLGLAGCGPSEKATLTHIPTLVQPATPTPEPAVKTVQVLPSATPTPEPAVETVQVLPSATPTPRRPTPAATLFVPFTPRASPTPDPTRPVSGVLTRTYTVGYGDTLLGIATYYGCSVEELVALNNLPNADSIWIGQQLLVPGRADRVGPDVKLIPDSELVYGPAYQGFDVAAFLSGYDGWLTRYGEEVEGRWRGGAELVQLVAQRYSVGPRVLLTLVELRSGGLTDPDPPPAEDTPWYPLGYQVEGWEGLWVQLSWAANQLNAGYYGWLERDQYLFSLGDGTWIQAEASLNAGTVGVQRVLGAGVDFATWSALLDRFSAVYAQLFGDPFGYAVEPLIPPDLIQPPLALPWPPEDTWYYTGGPHGGWGNGSSWAAIDITPPGESDGCFLSLDWATAAAAGLVVRSENGEVLVDLDGDGFEGTGWVLLYMHVDAYERVALGTWLEAGDRVGHPSCEGGFSNGTHLHFARRYNGQWVEADSASSVPLVLDGWTIESAGRPYDGWMSKGGVSQEACECREPSNAISVGD